MPGTNRVARVAAAFGVSVVLLLVPGCSASGPRSVTKLSDATCPQWLSADEATRKARAPGVMVATLRAYDTYLQLGQITSDGHAKPIQWRTRVTLSEEEFNQLDDDIRFFCHKGKFEADTNALASAGLVSMAVQGIRRVPRLPFSPPSTGG